MLNAETKVNTHSDNNKSEEKSKVNPEGKWNFYEVSVLKSFTITANIFVKAKSEKHAEELAENEEVLEALIADEARNNVDDTLGVYDEIWSEEVHSSTVNGEYLNGELKELQDEIDELEALMKKKQEEHLNKFLGAAMAL